MYYLGPFKQKQGAVNQPIIIQKTVEKSFSPYISNKLCDSQTSKTYKPDRVFDASNACFILASP